MTTDTTELAEALKKEPEKYTRNYLEWCKFNT